MQSFLESVNKVKGVIQLDTSVKAAMKAKLQSFMNAPLVAQEEMLREFAAPAQAVAQPLVETKVVARTEQTVE